MNEIDRVIETLEKIEHDSSMPIDARVAAVSALSHVLKIKILTLQREIGVAA